MAKNKVRVVPLTSFVHGHLDVHEGREFDCERGLAEQFVKANLVRVKRAPVQLNTAPQVTAGAAGKAPDDGAGQPSSASPAAPASPMTTSTPSAPGVRPSRRRGA